MPRAANPTPGRHGMQVTARRLRRRSEAHDQRRRVVARVVVRRACQATVKRQASGWRSARPTTSSLRPRPSIRSRPFQVDVGWVADCHSDSDVFQKATGTTIHWRTNHRAAAARRTWGRGVEYVTSRRSEGRPARPGSAANFGLEGQPAPQQAFRPRRIPVTLTSSSCGVSRRVRDPPSGADRAEHRSDSFSKKELVEARRGRARRETEPPPEIRLVVSESGISTPSAAIIGRKRVAADQPRVGRGFKLTK